MAPSLGFSIAYGLVGGIVGVIAIAILITIMEPKMDAVPPAIMTEHLFGDPDKKGMVMFPSSRSGGSSTERSSPWPGWRGAS